MRCWLRLRLSSRLGLCLCLLWSCYFEMWTVGIVAGGIGFGIEGGSVEVVVVEVVVVADHKVHTPVGVAAAVDAAAVVGMGTAVAVEIVVVAAAAAAGGTVVVDSAGASSVGYTMTAGVVAVAVAGSS